MSVVALICAVLVLVGILGLVHVFALPLFICILFIVVGVLFLLLDRGALNRR